LGQVVTRPGGGIEGLFVPDHLLEQRQVGQRFGAGGLLAITSSPRSFSNSARTPSFIPRGSFEIRPFAAQE